MGFVSDIATTVRGFFSKDKEQAAKQLSRGISADKFTGSASDLLNSVGVDGLAEFLRLDSDLLSRFSDYEDMDDYPELAAALDILADDSTQPNTPINRTMWVDSKDATVRENLDDLFHRTLRMDEEIWEIARNLVKYGNDYEELLVTGNGVVGLNFLPSPTVRRVEAEKGELLGFVQDYKGKYVWAPQEFDALLKARGSKPQEYGMTPSGVAAKVTGFEGWEVAHFRLRGKYRRSLYGYSALEPARWIWKRLVLLEDAALIYRLQRAPERFAFYIDVGDLPPQEALAYVNRVRQQFKKKKWVNPSTGRVDLKFDPLPVSHDTPVPLLDGRTLTIAGMAKEYEAGIKHWVHSIDRETGHSVPGEVEWVGKTREAAPAVKVTFDDGGWATMAPDHPVMRRDRSYANAVDLKPGDSVMPCYRRVSDKAKGDSLDGYEMVYDPEDTVYRYTHRVVSSALGLHQSGQVIHHQNFDNRNNTPTNLGGMTWDAHRALHIEAGHTGGAALARARLVDSELDAKLREASTRNITEYNQSADKRRQTSEQNKERDSGRYIRAYNSSEKHAQDNAIRSASMSAFWQDTGKAKLTKQKMSLKFPPEFVDGVKALIRANPKAETEDIAREVNESVLLEILVGANSTRAVKSAHRHMLLKLYRQEGSDSYAEFKASVLAPTNHKVVSVEFVEPCDHYCMTVKTWHNFALSLRDQAGAVIFHSGVFVKNSQDEDFFVPSRKGNDSAKIETLGAPQWQAMEDIEYFRDKMFAAIKVPKAYLGQESGVARAVLSSEDVRFARTVLRVQRELKNGSRKIARVHLSALNIDPQRVNYELNMTVPSAVFELAQMEVRTARADLANRMREFVSMHWIMSNVFSMSDSEIEDIFKQRGEDEGRTAVSQASAQAAQQAVLSGIPAGAAPEGEMGAPEGEGEAPAESSQTISRALSRGQIALTPGPRVVRPRQISERELFAGDREAERRAGEKLDKLLKSDRHVSARVEEIRGLMMDLRMAANGRHR